MTRPTSIKTTAQILLALLLLCPSIPLQTSFHWCDVEIQGALVENKAFSNFMDDYANRERLYGHLNKDV